MKQLITNITITVHYLFTATGAITMYVMFNKYVMGN